MICRNVKANLADLLLDPESVPVEVRSHVKECSACSKELESLEATMRLMDEWAAPEPTPYFDSKLAVRLREEQHAAPAGFLERMRARLLFGSNVSMRPLMAGALALLLILGGGTYAGLVTSSHSGTPVQSSAAIRDLQSLDDNAQVFQQLTAIDQSMDQDSDQGAGQNQGNGGDSSNPL